MPLKDQHIVVIGGTSGIGATVAAMAAAEGARLTLGSSSEAKLAAARQALPGATVRAVDVKREDSLASFFAATGGFDHLVYTAGDWGTARGKGFDDLDRAAAESLFAVRFWGAIAAINAARPHLAATGSIVLTDGMIAHRPRKGSAVSTAMAGAIEHLTRGLSVELAPTRVNAVCPGAIRTEIWNGIPEEQREARLKAMTARQPLARIGEPEEAGEAYLYLLKAGYTTGQVLMVDGGMSVI